MEATVYAHTVEGLLKRALGPRMTPALKAELLGLGLDVDGTVRDLPRTTWAQVLAASVRHIFGSLPTDEGYYQLGLALMAGYRETIIGRALFATLRMLGPHRALKRAVTLVKNGNNYIEGRLEAVGTNRYEMWVNECNGNPHYIRGVLTAALLATGIRGLVCEVKSFDGREGTYAARWD